MARDTLVEFVPSDADFSPEHGRFTLKLSDCAEYLRTHFGRHAIPLDGQLLNWLQERDQDTASGSRLLLPNEFDDRARFVVEQLYSGGTTFEVTCALCDRWYSAAEILQEDWDTSTVVEEIRAGAAGIKLLCPAGHDLLSICTRLY